MHVFTRNLLGVMWASTAVESQAVGLGLRVEFSHEGDPTAMAIEPSNVWFSFC